MAYAKRIRLESRRRSVINSARFAIDESAIKAERVARDGRKQISPSNGSIFKLPTGIPAIRGARVSLLASVMQKCMQRYGELLRASRRLITDHGQELTAVSSFEMNLITVLTNIVLFFSLLR